MEIVEKKIRIDEEEEYSLDQYNVEDITEL